MDDGGKPPHSAESGQQRTHHSRPFFYVQPPSQPQPYYMYQQWHLNNPYNHYGLPGLPGGYNFGRPYVPPYPYMQYPGLVLPHAPIHPADYRRMFEPRFHPPSGNDIMFRHQYHHAQGYREMACSEVQTDPSDVISKVIECLGKLRTNEMAAERKLDSGVTSQTSGIYSPGDERRSEEGKPRTNEMATERELDSGVTSQTSGMYSPGDERRSEERGATRSPSCAASEISQTQSPAMMFSDSTAAVYDGESSRRSLEEMSHRGCWSVGSDEELPLDSSSVHEEECTNAQQPAADDGQFLHHCPPAAQLENPTPEVIDHQSDDELTNPNVPKCNAEELLTQSLDAIMPSTPHPSSSEQALKDIKNGDIIKTEYQTDAPDKVVDLTYQILKLPFEKVLTAEALQKGSSMFCVEPPTALASSHLSSPAHPFYYSYLTSQTAHERMSVLSPSIDELSSRDEMFSTDLEDMDLFPTHVYTSRRHAEVTGRSPQLAEEIEEVWPVCSKKFICACCGKRLAKGASRSKVHSPKLYEEDEAGDSDNECRYGRSCEQPTRVVVKKHSVPRKLYSISLRHFPKYPYYGGHGKELPSTADQQEGQELCEGESGGVADGDLQYTDRPSRDDVTTPDQGRWEGGEVKARRRPPTPLPRREGTLRKAPRRPLVYHRSRDDDNEEGEEPPQFHRDRGSSTRGGPRC